ncbi:MAG: hypothetical protein AAFV25_23620, partial [Bacteroidota bacterium]
NQHIVRLFEYLRKYHPSLDHPQMDKELVFKKLFPKEAFDVQRLRLLMHRLARLVESFLVTRHLQTDSFHREKILAKELGRRNLYDLFQKKTLDLLDQLEEENFRDQHYYKQRIELYWDLYGHPHTNKQVFEMDTLYLAMDNLDAYFSLSKVQFAASIRERMNTLAEDNSIRFYEEVLEVGHQSFESRNQLFELFVSLNQLQGPQKQHELYEQLSKAFLLSFDRIRPQTQRDILLILLNFCLRKFNRGHSAYARQCFEHYKFGLEKGLLKGEYDLTETTFSNIVKLGATFGEFDWTEQFIQQYEDSLDENIREDAVTLSLSVASFFKADYNRTIELLATHRFAKMLQSLSAKGLLLRSYLELLLSDDSYFDLLNAQINNYEKYIRNNQRLASDKVEGYLNFAKFIRRIANSKYQDKKRERIQLQLEDCQNVILKSWLLKKMKK